MKSPPEFRVIIQFAASDDAQLAQKTALLAVASIELDEASAKGPLRVEPAKNVFYVRGRMSEQALSALPSLGSGFNVTVERPRLAAA
jgi:hypothetical protein